MIAIGLSLLSILLAATPFAQATPEPPDESSIPPVVWELVEYTEQDGDPVEIAEPERYTVQFLPDGELAVGADCNSAGASYTAEEGALEISPIRSTLILCPPDSQAQPFLTLLESAASYEFDEGALVLASASGSLRFRAALTGVDWEWLDFRGGDDSVVVPENPEDYTLTFLDEGKLAIGADCNRATGNYEVDGATLALTIGGVTRAMCSPESLMDRYLRDLADVSSYVFRDGNLYLALPVDAGIMSFIARAQEPSAAATPVAG